MIRERNRIQENANKYIVKNCPSYLDDDQCESAFTTAVWCEDCADCVIKRVIEKCKGEHERGAYYMFWVDKFAQEILELFDIEEIGNEDR